ncbi:RloA [Beggiatoa sp. PS]|nr:RloA [Beggiatoa sp. PS]
MLIQFKVNNFKSIKDTVTFSLNTATKDKNNSFKIRNYELLTSSVIYGANATGKSNLLQAMAFMRNMVLNKHKITQSTDSLPHQPFKLNIETETASSTFEMVFFVGEVKYRYGFEADNQQVYSEWLFQDTKGKEAKLFFRDVDESSDLYVNPQRFKEGYANSSKKDRELKVLPNHLFIWKCDQEGGEISSLILNWFKNLNFINGLENDGYIDFTMKQIESADFKNHIVSLVKIADLGISNVGIEKIPYLRNQ